MCPPGPPAPLGSARHSLARHGLARRPARDRPAQREGPAAPSPQRCPGVTAVPGLNTRGQEGIAAGQPGRGVHCGQQAKADLNSLFVNAFRSVSHFNGRVRLAGPLSLLSEATHLF